jgi:hypothetical protein
LQGHAAPTESGHPSYQLQAGSVRSRWGPYMDTFSGLVIYLALTALAKDPGLWPRFNNGDNLLFERGDFVLPYDTEVWNHLAGLSDPDIDKIVLKLKACCVPGWVASKSLPDMLKPTWWEAQGGSAPMATAWTALTATAGTAPAAATTPTGTPSSAAGTAPGTVPPPPQWHIPSISSQPTAPAGSLPPPPQVPYQSTVAAQSARTPFGGARQPGKPGTAGSGGSWWAQQQGNAPAGTIKSTPMMPNKNPPSNSSRAPLGGLVAVAGIIAFIALVAAHHALRGTALGLVLVVIGIVIAKSKSRT